MITTLKDDYLVRRKSRKLINDFLLACTFFERISGIFRFYLAIIMPKRAKLGLFDLKIYFVRKIG